MKTTNNKPLHNSYCKDTDLRAEFMLFKGFIPVFEIRYQGKYITGFFDIKIWGNKAAMLEKAKEVVQTVGHTVPFKAPSK